MALSPKLILLSFCVKILTASAWESACPPWWEQPLQPTFLPHPTDCSKYLTCVSGETVAKSCPNGLHWNNLRKICDLPWVASCNPRPVDCSFGQLLPHVDCDKYYLCLENSRKVVLYCPQFLHFNERSKKCVYWWYAGCGGWTPPAPTTLPPTTAPHPTTTQRPTTVAPTSTTLTTSAPTTDWPGTTTSEAPVETSTVPRTSPLVVDPPLSTEDHSGPPVWKVVRSK